MLSRALRGGGSLLGRRLGAPLSDGVAAAFTTSAAAEGRTKKRDPADEFIFKASVLGARLP